MQRRAARLSTLYRRKQKKLNVVDILKKKKLSDKEIFRDGSQLQKMLQQDADNIAKEFRMSKVPVKLSYNPSDLRVAFTNNLCYFINAGHLRYEKASREKKILYSFGALFHEIGHRIFTSFHGLRKYRDSILLGSLYPACPSVSYAQKENLEEILDFIQDEFGRRLFMQTAYTIFNIIEDGRIERLLFKFADRFSTATEGLTAIRNLSYDETDDFTFLIEKRENKELLAFDVTKQILLHYIRFGGIKGLKPSHKGDPSYRMLLRIKKYVDKALASLQNEEICTQVNLCIIELWPEMKEYIEQVREKEGLPPAPKPKKTLTLEKDETASESTAAETPSGSAKETGSDKSASDEEIKSYSGKDATADAEEATSGGGFVGEEVSKGEDEDSIEEGLSETEVSDAHEDATSKGASFGKESGERKIRPLSGLSEDDMKKVLKAITDSDLALDGLTADDFKIDESLDSTGTDKESIAKKIASLPAASVDAEEKEDTTIEEAEEKSDVTPSVHIKRLKIEAETEAKESMSEEILRDALEKLDDTIDYGKIHSCVRCKIFRPQAGPAQKAFYKTEATEYVELAKKMARRSDFFPKENSPVTVKNLYCGSKFHASTVAKADYRNFSKKKALPKSPSLSVAVLVDESGSMCFGGRIEAAKATAVTLYEYCDQLDIPIAIYGHSADQYSSGSVELFCYCDFARKDPNDRYRLANISDKFNNRDGYALRYVMERLKEQETTCKILFVISDGQPAASNYYSGSLELNQLAKQCAKEKMFIFAAAIGSDKENIKECYGEDHFLDITDLSKLPVLLTNRLRSLLKSYR